MANAELKIVEGIDEERLEDALRISYDAFAAKFRIGFRNADDLIRLFRDSIDKTSCLSAIVDGRLAGILTFQTASQEFYRLNTSAVFTRFLPLRSMRVMFNLALLVYGSVGRDEFIVDTLVVDGSCRGMGVGTALMNRAEDKAKSMGKRAMSLWVIGGNEGAIRLYERLGYKTTRTSRGFFVRLAVGDSEARRMEKPIGCERADAASRAAARTDCRTGDER